MKNINNKKEGKYSKEQQKAIYLAKLTSVVLAVLVVFHGGQSLERGKLLDQYYLEISTYNAIKNSNQVLNADEYKLKRHQNEKLNESVWVDNVRKSYGDKNNLPEIVVASYDQPVLEVTSSENTLQ
ncbi:MAG: hypothetical protein VYA60_04685 [Pseudomonadota bacterium]|nr:hypothetical protein [Pseudomonadota bacterium]